MLIKRLKKSDSIKNIFRNFTIKSRANKIDFIATIWIWMTNSDQKIQLKDNLNPTLVEI